MEDGYEKRKGSMESVSRPVGIRGCGNLRQCLRGCGTPRQCLRQNLLLILLFFAMCIGIGIGLGLRFGIPEFGEDDRKVMYLEFPGQLLMNMLKMMIIPLIVSSLIAGVANLPNQAAGRIGLRAIIYYMLTTFMAVLLGILLVTTIKPGNRGRKITVAVDKSTFVEPVDALLDLIRNALPPNIIAACFQQTKTTYKKMVVSHWETVNGSTVSPIPENKTVDDPSQPKVVTAVGSNVLGLVVFSVALGVVIGRMGEQGAILRNFFVAFSQAIITLVIVIIWYSPIGIIFLLAARIVKMDDPAQEFAQLAYYIATVLCGLIIHGFLILPLIYFVFTRKNPLRHLFAMGQALLTALGTASSSATLPITLRCLELKAKVSPIIGHFILPIGATINMDGTALYEAVASIYIAQYEGIPLNAGQIVIVSVTATAAAIGAAGVPEAGLVTMVIVLTAVGLPIESVGLIYAVDWFLDRFRTMINVWGDAVGAGVVEALSKKDLKRMQNAEAELLAATEEQMANGSINPVFTNADEDSITKL